MTSGVVRRISPSLKECRIVWVSGIQVDGIIDSAVLNKWSADWKQVRAAEVIGMEIGRLPPF